MNAPIDIPDEMVQRVEAKTAREGRAVPVVTMELSQGCLAEETAMAAALLPEQWLTEWIRLGAEALHSAPSAPTATEILADDRNRLERS